MKVNIVTSIAHKNKHKKIKEKLGMSHGTAYYRLLKDLIFNFIVSSGCNSCHQCGLPMTRKDFSIEHKNPWLNSDASLELFFDLKNIGYSHFKCNTDESVKRNMLTPEQREEVFKKNRIYRTQKQREYRLRDKIIRG